MEYHLSIAGERSGPHTQFTLIERIREGTLKGDELVWHIGITEWKPLRDLNEFSDYWKPTPETITQAEEARRIARISLDAPQPWPRFWARMLDYTLFLTVLSMVVKMTLPKSAIEWYANAVVGGASLPMVFFLNVLPFLLFAPLEAFCLSRSGTTPGKAFLRIQVRRLDGSLPRFQESLIRSLLVLVKGLALCIPIFSLFSMSWCRLRLLQSGRTKWDEQTGLRVEHGEPEMWRHLVVIAIMGFVMLCFILAVQQMMEMTHTTGLPK